MFNRLRARRALLSLLGALAVLGAASVVFAVAAGSVPAPSITAKPADPTALTAAAFSFTDSKPGVTFRCSLDASAFTSCASPLNFAGPLALGSHSFRVRAVTATGNLSSITSYTWQIVATGPPVDTKPPPAPVITEHPSDPVYVSNPPYSVSFTLTDTEAGVRFECKLDGAAFTACTSPITFGGLPEGVHTFNARAVDAAGNVSVVALLKFHIINGVPGKPFTISGNAATVLYPGGATATIAAKLNNPTAKPLFVTGLTVTIAGTGLPLGCDSGWFEITQSNISPVAAVKLPANGSVTLPAQGVSAPTVRMIETGTNQDACKSAQPTLTFTGSAHS
jgi:hypothetical protein